MCTERTVHFLLALFHSCTRVRNSPEFIALLVSEHVTKNPKEIGPTAVGPRQHPGGLQGPFFFGHCRRQKSKMISFPLLTQLDGLSGWSFARCLRPFRISAFNLNSTSFGPSFSSCRRRRSSSVKQSIHSALYVWIAWSNSNFKFVLLPRTWDCILRSMPTATASRAWIQNKNREAREQNQ